jgi:hypothetical protein
MKIIEGTPEEIKEYLNKEKNLIPLAKIASNPYKYKVKETVHWSSTKHQWVSIKDMDASYILNTIKKMLRTNPSNGWLLQEDEFKSLIINLADKIEEEKV